MLIHKSVVNHWDSDGFFSLLATAQSKSSYLNSKKKKHLNQTQDNFSHSNLEIQDFHLFTC
jgi:hypothetical protein